MFYWRASEGLPGMWGGLPAGPAWGALSGIMPNWVCSSSTVRHLFYTWYAPMQCTPWGWDEGVEGCKGAFRGSSHAAFLGGAVLAK